MVERLVANEKVEVFHPFARSSFMTNTINSNIRENLKLGIQSTKKSILMRQLIITSMLLKLISIVFAHYNLGLIHEKLEI